MIQASPPFNLRPMQIADLPRVMAIEEEAFHTPWPADAYEHEITRNPAAYCIVLERGDDALVAYGCLWLVVDEIHISTLAVAPPWRGCGWGEMVLSELIVEGIRRGGTMATLEVRVSNRAAQTLYSKFGFQVVGLRKRYYTDNQEDALIMTVEPLDSSYRERLAGMRDRLLERLISQREGIAN